MLQVENLQIQFSTEQGVARVLDNVNLTINKGEVLGLVGESGCGKTTLARSILGTLPPSADVTSGSVVFDGEDILQKSPRELNSRFRGNLISYIPQDPFSSFNPVFSVGAQFMELMKWKSPLLRERGAYMQEGLWPALLTRYPRERYKKDYALVVQALKDVQIAQPELALKRLPHEFSGGQRQRLMIAMALLPNPELIIADEPTTALDVTIQAQVLSIMHKLIREKDISILFTTHDLGTAYEICDRIMVMYAGQEMETAPTNSFFEQPTHPYTRKLLESLPTRDLKLQEIPGEIPSLINPPPGCRFHPRCEYASDLCKASRPDNQEIIPEHFLRCHTPLLQSDNASFKAIARTKLQTAGGP